MFEAFLPFARLWKYLVLQSPALSHMALLFNLHNSSFSCRILDFCTTRLFSKDLDASDRYPVPLSFVN